MSMLLWGLTIGMFGKVLLGVAVLRVHMGILKEHKIDGAVLRAIKKERLVTYGALALIVLGYLLEVVSYTRLPLFEAAL